MDPTEDFREREGNTAEESLWGRLFPAQEDINGEKNANLKKEESSHGGHCKNAPELRKH